MQLPWRAADFHSDPYTSYQALRTMPPIFTDEGFWVVARYSDVAAVLKDPHFGNAEVRLAQNAEPTLSAAAERPGGAQMRQVLVRSHQLINMWLGAANPPSHSRLRAAHNPGFSQVSVARLLPRIQAAVDDLLDEVQAAGEMDLMASVAGPLPVAIISHLLDLPAADVPRLKSWSDALLRLLDMDLKLAAYQKGLLSMAAFAQYLRPVIAARRRAPDGDLISLLLRAEANGQLSADEVLANSINLFMAGQETTMAAIGSSVLALLRHPEQLRRLRAEPKLMPGAVEEFLRYDAPVQIAWRTVIADVDLFGCAFRKDQRVELLLGAANRDSERFLEPDEIVLDRKPNPHLGFGQGIHYCLGAHQARLQVEVALSTLLRRLPELALHERPPEWAQSLRLRRLKSLWVRF